MFGFSEIKKIHAPTVVQGGGGVDGTPPWSFWYGGGGAAGLWRHQQLSPSWILQRVRNKVKTVRNCNFFALHEE